MPHFEVKMTLINNKKILFAGDPHGNFDQINSAVIKYKPEAVFFLGDYDLDLPFEEYLKPIVTISKIFWIHGNHDFSKKQWHDNLFKSAYSSHSIHLKVVDVAGIRIAGLGGVFLSKIWYPPATPKWDDKSHFLEFQPSNVRKQQGLLKHQSAIWPNEFDHLKKLNADILVTHEAPSCHKYGFDVIDELAREMGVKKIVHGHHHEHYVDSVNEDTAVYGVDIRGVVDLAGNNVVCKKRWLS